MITHEEVENGAHTHTGRLRVEAGSRLFSPTARVKTTPERCSRAASLALRYGRAHTGGKMDASSPLDRGTKSITHC